MHKPYVWPKLKIIRDDPVVKIWDGNIEGAIRALKRKTESLGNFKALNLRRRYPSKQDRARVKARKATRRARQAAKTRRLYGFG